MICETHRRSCKANVEHFEDLYRIAFLQRPIFHEVHVPDACDAHFADHEFLDVDHSRNSVRGWSPGQKVACSFCCFEWACPQAKFFTVWVKQDWLIGLELRKLSRIQGNIDSKAAGNCSESFLGRWNKGFGSNAFHSDLIGSQNPNTSVS